MDQYFSMSRVNHITTEGSMNVDDLVYLICIIDIFFLPYIRLLSASLSMIILPFWFLFRSDRFKVTKEFKLFFVAFFFILLSTGLSAINYPLYVRSNLASFVILVYGFLYYFFFDYYFKKRPVSLVRPLMVYLTFAMFLATVYYANPSAYFWLRSVWTMSGRIIEVQSSLMIHRFTSTFSDPNNAATVFIAIFAFLMFNNSLSLIQKVYVFAATGIVVFATMSSTGLVVFGGVLIFLALKAIRSLPTRKIRPRSILALFVLFVVLVPTLYRPFLDFVNSDIVQLALKRYSDNTMTSRTKIWMEMIKAESPVYSSIYGYGGTIILNDRVYRPHNGHLHLIYNYGMISYVVFMYIIFRIRRGTPFVKQFFMIPFLIGFTVNVGIIEPRFLNILVLLVAHLNCSSKQNDQLSHSARSETCFSHPWAEN